MTSRKAWTGKGNKLARTLAKAEDGAVAATYALALFALIAIAGVGFDYARLATMDTELQNAADQAALAAATQLDGRSDSITRATTAAQELVENETLLSNDSDGRKIGIDPTLTFYATRADAEAETSPTTDPLKARYVRVSVMAREAFYALTPIVGAISSGDVDAHATAGMGSAICKTPPVMMCNPATNPANIDIDSLKGRGVLLKAKSGAWAPGDFGFLDVGAGASDLGKLLGYANPPGDCIATDMVTTEPGQMTSVIKYLNTRFDIYDNVDGSVNCYSDSLCPPSDNSRKDVVQSGTALTVNKNDCQLANNANQPGWKLTPNPYRPTQAETYAKQLADGDRTTWPDHMGYPRDICHAFAQNTAALPGGCGRIGDGNWDIQAYWRANYPNDTGGYTGQVNGKSNPTRYEVYQWERTHGVSNRKFVSDGKNWVDHKAAVCRSGSAPATSAPDRRVIPVAVVDCTGMTGKADRAPLDFVDAFLVEPSIKRTFGGKDYTDVGDIYVEVIGRTGQGTGGSAPQFVRRDKPYLIR